MISSQVTFVLLSVLVISNPAARSDSTLKSCTINEIADCEGRKEQYDQFIKKVEQLEQSPDSFLKTVRDPKGAAYYNQKYDSLLEETKSLVKKAIQGIRTTKELSAEEKILFEHIDSIKLNPFGRPFGNAENVCITSGFAKMQVTQPLVTICPIMDDLPKSQMIGVLAHEIMHNLQRCPTSSPAYKDEDGVHNGFEVEMVSMIPSLLGGATAEEEKLIQALRNRPIAIRAIPHKAYPLQNLEACLLQNSQLYRFNREDSTQVSDATHRFRKYFHDSSHELGSYIDSHPNDEFFRTSIVNDSNMCLTQFTHDQSQEVVSDWIAAEAQGLYLNGKDEPEKKNALFLFSALYCREKNSKPGPLNEHPSNEIRLENIFLKNNRLRTSLGCNTLKDVCDYNSSAAIGGGLKAKN